MFDSPRRNWLAGLGIVLSVSIAGMGAASAQDKATTPDSAAAQKSEDAQGGKVMATVNGDPITNEEITFAENTLDPQFAKLPPEQRRAAALSALIEIRVLANEAVKEKLDQDPDFKSRMQFLRNRALHSAYVQKEIAPEVTEKEVRARYDKEVAAAPPVNEIHARHILVKTKEEAEDIIKKLDNGGDFEKIAKEKSQDGSAAQGGDLGYFALGQMVPAFEKAAFALDVGKYTEQPVQTQFGWHIIKVEDKRTKQPPAFDDVKQQIEQIMLTEKYLERVNKLRDAADVDIKDADLKKSVDALESAKQPDTADQPADEDSDEPMDSDSDSDPSDDSGASTDK